MHVISYMCLKNKVAYHFRACSYLLAPSLLGDSVALEIPGVVHHKLEVVISVDGHGHVGVVLEPLVHRDLSISGVGVSSHVAEVVLEGIKELSKNFFFGLLARLNVWVLLGVVRLSDVVDIDLAGSIRVHLGVSLSADSNSGLVHVTSDGSEELLIGDLSASVSVEDSESSENLLIGKTDSEVVHGLLELLLIEGSRVVVIGNLEFLADAHETSGSSGGELGSYVLHDLGLGGVSWDTNLGSLLLWSWSVENVIVLLGSWLSISPALGSLTLSGLLGKLPGVGDHGHEVHVIFDGARDVVVVLLKLLLGHNVVWGRVVSHVVGGFKSLEELLEDLLLGLLSRNDIWVRVGLVDTSDIIDIDPAVTVLVELLVSLSDDLLSSHVHWASDSSDELVVSDGATGVNIEIVEKSSALWLSETELVVGKSLAEFSLVQSL